MNQQKEHIDSRHRLDEQTEKLLQQLTVPTGRSKDEVWESLGSVISSETSPVKRQLIPASWIVAASFALLLSLGSLLMFHTTDVECPRGQHVAVVLPDGSNVLLNSESKLSYQKYLWWKKRKVNLTGEAFFKVKKGKRFSVMSNGYETSVLGTSFNVFARNNQVKVVCFTGKVKVKEVKTGSEAILTPGLGVISSGDKIGQVQKIGANTKGWTSGEFYFYDAPLTEVFAEMERQFNIKVHAHGLEKRRYSGYFSSKDMQQALELVCVPMQLTFRVSGDSVVVKTAN